MQGVNELNLYVHDLTREQPDPPDYSPPHHKIVRDIKKKLDRVFVRDPKTVDGIMIHQTGTPFGISAKQIADAKGDKILAKHRRALGIAAHMTAFDTGYAVLAHPLLWYVYHGNGLNARSIGMEIEGLYPGSLGKKELFVGNVERAAQEGLTYLVRKGRELGMPLKYIWAHRQSSMTRAEDPGEEIWRKLVVNFAVPTLGLLPQNTYVDEGRAIPETWTHPMVSRNQVA